MPEYWFIVKQKNAALYRSLCLALERRPGYHVIEERRQEARTPDVERRRARTWEGDNVTIAEVE